MPFPLLLNNTEIMLLVAMVLRKFDVTFADGQPFPRMKLDCLVGVPKPEADARVLLSTRSAKEI